MTFKRIMYVCSECADGYPEGSGYYDRNELRVLPDGRWLCDGCFEETTQHERGNDDEDKDVGWCDFPVPPEYEPKKGATP